MFDIKNFLQKGKDLALYNLKQDQDYYYITIYVSEKNLENKYIRKLYKIIKKINIHLASGLYLKFLKYAKINEFEVSIFEETYKLKNVILGWNHIKIPIKTIN